VPQLPAAMRDDFVAVRIHGERAGQRAHSTGRSAAAVSKNLTSADTRLRTFLAERSAEDYVLRRPRG
jgi:hypothetical protein